MQASIATSSAPFSSEKNNISCLRTEPFLLVASGVRRHPMRRGKGALIIREVAIEQV